MSSASFVVFTTVSPSPLRYGYALFSLQNCSSVRATFSKRLFTDTCFCTMSNVRIEFVAQGVRYIQHSLGRPSEQKWFPGRRVPKVIFEV